MKTRRPVILVALVTAALWAAPAAGQEASASKGAWTPPKMADGTPDFQGDWEFSHYPDGTFRPASPAASIEAYTPTPFRNGGPSLITDPANGRIPYQPPALAKKRSFTDLSDHAPLAGIDPNAFCSPQGVPRSAYMPGGIQILQEPNAVTIISEFGHNYRYIPTDGRPHAAKNLSLWQGDSRGHWEGNTLVIDVTNLNGKPWMDSVGNFTSDSLHVTERFTLLDANSLLYEATVEDPTLYARPWKMTFKMARKEPGYELMEHACHEGEHSFEHIIEANPEVLRSVK
jgi:hypothetical protein